MPTYYLDTLFNLADNHFQYVLSKIDKQTLAIALKSDCDLFKIEENMSKRAFQMLLEDMEYLGPMRLSDVMCAQKDILDTIRRLEEAGEIVIRKNSDE